MRSARLWLAAALALALSLPLARADAASDDLVARAEAAKAALHADGTVDEALATFEANPVAPLIDALQTLDARGMTAAAAYARLLARSVDRLPEGVALLEKLNALHPGDPQLSLALTAARDRLAVQQGAPNNGARILESGTKEVTLGTASIGRGPTISIADRVFATEYRNLGTAGVSCATLSIYDRASFALEGIIPITGCDDEQQDSISDVAVVHGYIYVAVAYRFEQAGRTDLVYIHAQVPSISGRYDLMGGIESLVATKDGLITCGFKEHCVLQDVDFLGEKQKDVGPLVVCRPRGRAFPAEIGADALSRVTDKSIWIKACNDRLAAVLEGPYGEKSRIALYRLDKPEQPVAEVPSGQWPQIVLGDPGAPTFVSEQQSEAMFLRSILPESGKTRLELALKSPLNDGTVWTADGNTIFVARGRDLRVYDAVRGTVRAFLKNVVPDTPGPRQDGQFIASLIVDREFDRLIVVTGDGRHSQIISLAALRKLADDANTPWNAADAVLAADPAQ